MLRTKILGVLFLMLSFSAFAQKTKKKVSSAEEITLQPSIKTKVFEGLESGLKPDPICKIIFKTAPLIYLKGDYPIYVETRISDKFSVETGFGITKLTIPSLRSTKYQLYGNNPRMGFSARFSVRYYPRKTQVAPIGWSIYPEFEFRNFNFYEPNNAEAANTSNNSMEFKLMASNQVIFLKKLILEFYLGFGLVTYNRELATSVERINNLGTSVFIKEKEIESNQFATLYFGFKFGVPIYGASKN